MRAEGHENQRVEQDARLSKDIKDFIREHEITEEQFNEAYILAMSGKLETEGKLSVTQTLADQIDKASKNGLPLNMFGKLSHSLFILDRLPIEVEKIIDQLNTSNPEKQILLRLIDTPHAGTLYMESSSQKSKLVIVPGTSKRKLAGNILGMIQRLGDEKIDIIFDID